MSDFPSRPELDDELLSAYLDDELSPQERAAVEARLADDASAREMLHQLRAVSQAVYGLPQEIVGHDLGESVLRRATRNAPEVATLVSPTTESHHQSEVRAEQFEDSFPKFTIGRSPRGWFWASLAVAAALFVMFQQSGREGREEPRAVALREEQVVREEVGRGTSERGELELRSLDEPTSAVSSDGLAVDAAGSAAPADAVRSLDQRQSEMSPALEPAARPSNENIADLGTVPALATRGPRGGAANQATADSDASATAAMPSETPAQTSPSPPATDTTVDSLAATQLSVTDNNRVEELADAPAAQEQPVVVRVLARREALESKAFDRLLESNGIVVDAAIIDDTAIATVRARNESEMAEQKEVETVRAKSSPQSPASGREEEVLLVEAPASAITSSLETLVADEVNYLGIKVDETAAAETSNVFDAGAVADYSTQDQEAFSKKLEMQQNWTKYNRGIVPQSGYAVSGDRYYFYDRGNSGNDRYRTELRFGGGGYGASSPSGMGGQQELAQQRLPVGRKSLGEQSRGRARRLQTWGIEAEPQAEQLARRRYAMPQQSAATTAQPGRPLEKISELSSGAADRVQVLFVISPADVPASSPPARNKAQ